MICNEPSSFHPFQGRPPFGQEFRSITDGVLIDGFPSLSGKTSIRTSNSRVFRQTLGRPVSIPFREDLHSDVKRSDDKDLIIEGVSIPFREDLHSDSIW